MLKKTLKLIGKIYKPQITMESNKFQKTQFNIKENSPNFVKLEEEVLQFWDDIDAFKLQLEHTKDQPHYTFYDGPPFATGLPHYGHICAGTIKDVITRYASMNGYHVERNFGWDCHGLPIEFQIDKELNIKNRNEIVDLGIDVYNEKCRGIVMKYSSQWRQTIKRLGRWIDFDNDYKTMDKRFMESVWWVFSEIFKKGFVYRGCKIMPYSNACMTVLSNFEAQQNYQDVKDPAIVVTFPLQEDESVSFLAWTTTPWTLPSNLALSVNPKFTYVQILDTKTQKKFILAKSRLVQLYKSAQPLANCEAKNYKEKKGLKFKEFEILKEYKGKDLEGMSYQPLFNYYEEKMTKKGCFKVLCADFVTSESGTGIVHTAPGFGADDYSTCRQYNIIDADDPCVSVDDSGYFIDTITDYKGTYLKDADKLIIQKLKENKRLIRHEVYEHSYPMCWRSDTPLIYKAVSCWFIRVTDVKEKLLVNNMKSKWVPQFAQTGRFQKWLENSIDWCFSRNRYWGNPIPLWVSDDFEEVVCVSSSKELIELAGLPKDTVIDDIHMHNINHIEIPSKMGKGMLKRIPETFDCWFESGSMPYAQKGFPYEMSEEEFKKRFPADFIGEGIDQTRGWFYTLNVIGTILFDTCPFKNLVVNGIVKAADGKKLSKRLLNYTDPMILINKYGSDALRLYLMDSPLVKGQDLRFKDEEVYQLLTQIFVPWYQLIRLLNQEINRYENLTSTQFQYQENLFSDESDFSFDNIFDQWILAKTQEVLVFVHQEFDNYRLFTVLKKQLSFLKELSNWYVNLNKKRFKGEKNPQEAFISLNVFYHCFFNCILSMAPYVPFIVESFYQDLKKVMNDKSSLKKQSIHLLRIPQANKKFLNSDLVEAVTVFQKLISNIRKERDLRKISRKVPFKTISIHTRDPKIKNILSTFESYIMQEGNVIDVQFGDDFKQFVKINFKPNIEVLKEQIPEKSKFGKLFPLINKMDDAKKEEFLKNKKVEFEVQFGKEKEIFELNEDNLLIATTIVKQPEENHLIAGEEDFVYDLDIQKYDELNEIYLSREITSRIQKTRKDALVNIDDKIVIVLKFSESSQNLKKVFLNQKDYIKGITKKPVLLFEEIKS